ncbi:MAG TPA: hypothetical protein VLZ84_06420 [Asticcacaulis sp.]|nr:hypothetical protein [Asticcacaulis sp.]
MRRLALTALLILSACDKPGPTAAPAAPAPPLPAGQTAFLGLPRTGEDSDDFCTKFKTFDRFEGWRGKVRDLRISTLDGAADLEIDIGKGIRLEAIVTKTDPVYPALLKLGMEQAIVVSGQFTHANNDADCLYYRGPFGVHLTGLDL